MMRAVRTRATSSWRASTRMRRTPVPSSGTHRASSAWLCLGAPRRAAAAADVRDQRGRRARRSRCRSTTRLAPRRASRALTAPPPSARSPTRPRSQRISSGRATSSSACGPVACASAMDTPRRRSTSCASRGSAGGHPCGGLQRRQHHGAREGPHPLLREARPRAHVHRRPQCARGFFTAPCRMRRIASAPAPSLAAIAMAAAECAADARARLCRARQSPTSTRSRAHAAAQRPRCGGAHELRGAGREQQRGSGSGVSAACEEQSRVSCQRDDAPPGLRALEGRVIVTYCLCVRCPVVYGVSRGADGALRRRLATACHEAAHSFTCGHRRAACG